MPRWGMVIDLEKCTGCQDCATACQMENNRSPGEEWQDVLFYSEGEYPNSKLQWLPRPCMHCENPSCLAVCPTGATYKTEDGVVLIDWERCIGCKSCVNACPYGARFYADGKPKAVPDFGDVLPSNGEKAVPPPAKMADHLQNPKQGIGVQPRNVVSKCTFCYHRISKAPKGTVDFDPNSPEMRDFVPACILKCGKSARYFGDLDHPGSEVRALIAQRQGRRLLEQISNHPQVYYLAGGAPSAPKKRKPQKAKKP